LDDDKPSTDPGDVLGKADALLRRRSIAPPASGAETGGVPVLTDLVPEDAAPREEPAPAPAPATPNGASPSEPAAAQMPPRAPVDEALARELVASVTAQLEARVAADLERRVTAYLVPEVRTAVAAALAELRRELADAIAEAVAGALERRK
jgi:hypothetical protein